MPSAPRPCRLCGVVSRHYASMPSIQHYALTNTLAALEDLSRGDSVTRLRVGLKDGTVLDGTLESASLTHLALVLPNAQARLVPASEIRSVHSARRRPLRKLAVLGLGIILGTAGVGVLYQVPLLRPHFASVVGVFLLLGAAGAMQVVRRTVLGEWMTSWETLYDSERG